MDSSNEVYITRTGKYYHYMDEACLITARILKGNTKARKVLEAEANKSGYTVCRHCAKKYEEQLVEQKNSPLTSTLLLEAGFSFWRFSYELISGALYRRES